MTDFFIVSLVSYLIGSVPSGFLIGKLAGIDIRQHGSGNIGATNVTRVLGKRFGYPVFLADFFKGLSAIILAPIIGRAFASSHSAELLQVLAGACAVLGNAFPVWLRFRGGKGVATSAGIFFGLTPAAAIVAIVVWVAIFYATRYVSVASLTAAVSLPLAIFGIGRITGTPRSLVLYVSIGLAIMVFLRHRSNLSRLMRGTEQRAQRSED